MAKKLEAEEPKQPEHTGETASELTHRHLSDQHHETTDEEIRNIKLDLDSTEGILPYNGQETSAPDADDDKDDIITTPASVFGE